MAQQRDHGAMLGPLYCNRTATRSTRRALHSGGGLVAHARQAAREGVQGEADVRVPEKRLHERRVYGVRVASGQDRPSAIPVAKFGSTSREDRAGRIRSDHAATSYRFVSSTACLDPIFGLTQCLG